MCIECHEEGYGGMFDEWVADAATWMKTADARLQKIRPRVAARGGKAAEALQAAESILTRLRISRPAHNVLLFEQEKDTFDEAATEAEKALK